MGSSFLLKIIHTLKTNINIILWTSISLFGLCIFFFGVGVCLKLITVEQGSEFVGIICKRERGVYGGEEDGRGTIGSAFSF